MVKKNVLHINLNDTGSIGLSADSIMWRQCQVYISAKTTGQHSFNGFLIGA